MTKNVSIPEYWDRRYQTDDSAWDLNRPTPVFVDILSRSKNLECGKIAVLGAGSGYDAILFAKHGFDVTAIDFSFSAIQEIQRNAEEAHTSLQTLQSDLFSLPDWTNEAFDYVLEYVTFCAIDPRRRQEFAEVVASILKPNGLLIALFFPIDNRPGGPPYAVDIEKVKDLFGRKFFLECEEAPKTSVTPRRGKEKLMMWRRKPSL